MRLCLYLLTRIVNLLHFNHTSVMNPTTLNKETAKNIYMFQKKKTLLIKCGPQIWQINVWTRVENIK